MEGNRCRWQNPLFQTLLVHRHCDKADLFRTLLACSELYYEETAVFFIN